MSALLFGTSPADPLTLGAAAAVLLGVAMRRVLHPGAPRHARRPRPLPGVRSVIAASPGSGLRSGNGGCQIGNLVGTYCRSDTRLPDYET